MNENISDFFPVLQEKAGALYDVMTPIAMVMVTAGLMTAIYRARLNPTEYVNSIVGVGIVALAIAQFPEWSNMLQDIAHGLLEELNANPSKSHENFARFVAGISADSDQKAGLWDVLFSENGGIGKAILYAIIFLLAKVASAIMWLFFVLQQLLIQFQIGLAPVFLAMFLIGPLRNIAVQFLMSFSALLLWPVGWGIASLMTDSILQLAATNGPSSIDRVSLAGDTLSFGLASTQITFFTLVLTIWILLSTIAAPLIIQKLLTSGANAGAILLSNVGQGMTQAALYGASGGLTAAMAGASPAISSGAAAIAATSGAVAGSRGSTGVTIPSAIGIGAAVAVSNSSSAGGSPTNHTAKANNLANQARNT